MCTDPLNYSPAPYNWAIFTDVAYYDSMNSLDESFVNYMDDYEEKNGDIVENKKGVWTCLQWRSLPVL